ncbi:transcription factor [Pseudohyphozyma bogoriensis]|nr:transcription factor [Pseudohyphozyma bogoriensis]
MDYETGYKNPFLSPLPLDAITSTHTAESSLGGDSGWPFDSDAPPVLTPGVNELEIFDSSLFAGSSDAHLRKKRGADDMFSWGGAAGSSSFDNEGIMGDNATNPFDLYSAYNDDSSAPTSKRARLDSLSIITPPSPAPSSSSNHSRASSLNTLNTNLTSPSLESVKSPTLCNPDLSLPFATSAANNGPLDALVLPHHAPPHTTYQPFVVPGSAPAASVAFDLGKARDEFIALGGGRGGLTVDETRPTMQTRSRSQRKVVDRNGGGNSEDSDGKEVMKEKTREREEERKHEEEEEVLDDEARRKKILLERNRLAAIKSRKKKKERAMGLEAQASELCVKNANLQSTASSLLAEARALRHQLLTLHDTCSCEHVGRYSAREQSGGGMSAIMALAGQVFERDYAKQPKLGKDGDCFEDIGMGAGWDEDADGGGGGQAQELAQSQTQSKKGKTGGGTEESKKVVSKKMQKGEAIPVRRSARESGAAKEE